MKIATIGTGFIVHTFMDAASEIDGIELTHMYSRSTDSALPLATEFNIKNIFTNIEDMLKEDFDVLYVASPNSLHYPQTKQALLAGKHVICEKPFVANTIELDELVSIAKENNLILFEAITTQSMPNYHALKERLSEIGKVRLAQVNFTQYSSRYDKFRDGVITNAFDPKFQGGALADIGIYNLHFIVGLFGKPLKAQYFPNMQSGIDTSGIAILSYDGFQVSSLIAKDSEGATGVHILGEDASLHLEDTPSICRNFSLTKKRHTESISLWQDDKHMVYELTDFYNIWKNKDFMEAEKRLQHSREVIEVFEECKNSMKG